MQRPQAPLLELAAFALFEPAIMREDNAMKNLRLAFLIGIAVLIVTALVVWSPTLLNSTTPTGKRSDLPGPPQPRYETSFDRPHPELRLERLLGLDDSNGFNPDIASLFKNERDRQQETVKQTGTTYHEVASVSHDK